MSAAVAIRQEIWPTLGEMGITRFHEVSHYTLRQDGENRDVLKISYKRQKGSLLPESRKYRFGRSLKTVVADGGRARFEDTYEISPYLLRAVVELDRLVASNALVAKSLRDGHDGSDRKAEILVELNHIERTVSGSMPAADAATIASKFSDVRRRIEAL